MSAGVVYRLHAIFSSLQGEGRNMGRPCTFIRFSACNLSCSWCDTHKSVKYIYTVDQILAEVRKLGNRSVIITGGEPTIQPDLDELLVALKNDGRWLALETNGIVAPTRPELYDYIACSPKVDYAGRYVEGKMIARADEVRIVATSEIIAPFCQRMRTMITATDYYISPLDSDGRIHYHRATEVLKKVNALDPNALPPWSLSIQMHKVLGIR